MPVSEAQEGARPWFKSPWLWGFVFGALALTGLRPLQQLFLHAPAPLASIGTWELVDQDARPFGSEALRGKVWVADYFFTRCPSVCPGLTRSMMQVSDAFSRHGDKIALVSFTVDPEHDTPEVLRGYAERFGIRDPRWHFVTGPQDKVVDLITKRMFLPLGDRVPLSPTPADGAERDGQAQLFDISHLARFALFDQNGDLRGTFTTDLEGLAALGNATNLLVEHGPNP